MITLLLVEDELLVRQGLRMWLDRTLDLTVVGEASNGAEAMTLAQALHPRWYSSIFPCPQRGYHCHRCNQTGRARKCGRAPQYAR
jgi:predicted RNA-binding Zn-ribbon protein involved in translation (DUF1610 family)